MNTKRIQKRILVEGLSFLLAVAVSHAQQGEASVDGVTIDKTDGGCIVSMSAGSSFRLLQPSPTEITVEIRGGTASGDPTPVASHCADSIRVRPLTAGDGFQVDMGVRAGSFRSLESSGGRLRVLLGIDPHAEATGQNPAGAYRIGVDDRLVVAVSRPVVFSRDVVVDRDGNITFDNVGKVGVAGLTAVETSEKLKKLIDGVWLVDPEVSVTVKEFLSQFVFVNGQVKKPGKQFLKGGTTLKDVISEAEGFSPEAGDEVMVTRGRAGKAEEQKFTLSRVAIESGLANLDLQPGDVVTVSEKRYFSIVGEVQRPGRYQYEAGLTLLQSIAIAGGWKEWANLKEIRLLRNLNGQLVGETHNLRDIEKHKNPDVPLHPGDSIIVPRRLL